MPIQASRYFIPPPHQKYCKHYSEESSLPLPAALLILASAASHVAVSIIHRYMAPVDESEHKISKSSVSYGDFG